MKSYSNQVRVVVLEHFAQISGSYLQVTPASLYLYSVLVQLAEL